MLSDSIGFDWPRVAKMQSSALIVALVLVDAIGITSGHLERVHENQVGDSIDGTGTLLYGVYFQR